MSRIFLLFFSASLFLLQASKAQEQETPEELLQHFEELYNKWHELEPGLGNYEGFKKYCTHREYKAVVHEVMRKLHHYDSIILSKANDLSYEMDHKERKKILKEITKFETKYSTKKFIKVLKTECHERHEIEHSKKDSKGDFADASYDGQKIILETELYKYSRHITKRIDHIHTYLNHLELHEIID